MTTTHEGGGKPLDAAFLGRFEHTPLTINGREVEESIMVVVEEDRIIMSSPKMWAGERVYKILTEDGDIEYNTEDDGSSAGVDVTTGGYEGKKGADGNPVTMIVRHLITVEFTHRHSNGEPYAQYNSDIARRILGLIFLRHWERPEQDSTTTDEDFEKTLDHYNQEMHTFIHRPAFNRVVPPVTPVDDDPVDDNPIDDNPIDDNPIDDNPVDDNPVDDGPVKDDGGGGVLPLVVGGGAALILLLMVK